MTSKDLKFEDISVGRTAEFQRTIVEDDIRAFAELTGDQNPLHTDHTYASTRQFGGTIAHGMLVGSLFSTLVGMHLPGKRCLYLSQTLYFRRPIRPGDSVTVRGTVSHSSPATRILTLRTEVFLGGEVCVDGEATVQVL